MELTNRKNVDVFLRGDSGKKFYATVPARIENGTPYFDPPVADQLAAAMRGEDVPGLDIREEITSRVAPERIKRVSSQPSGTTAGSIGSENVNPLVAGNI